MENAVVEDEELAGHCSVALPALAKGESVVVQAKEENWTEHIVDVGINAAGRDKVMARPVRRGRKTRGVQDCAWQPAIQFRQPRWQRKSVDQIPAELAGLLVGQECHGQLAGVSQYDLWESGRAEHAPGHEGMCLLLTLRGTRNRHSYHAHRTANGSLHQPAVARASC